ncbi:hypothetical protein BHM03_00002880 [Ensete ventricosum]|uniref:Uncharacterized protein n=1 Tax=Ensete ventricosum TaxID=4639 RepID=A0A445M9Z2_ENSVE|nr:hypothetical protein BHM03_00002880 [Ensete ventricosum]
MEAMTLTSRKTHPVRPPPRGVFGRSDDVSTRAARRPKDEGAFRLDRFNRSQPVHCEKAQKGTPNTTPTACDVTWVAHVSCSNEQVATIRHGTGGWRLTGPREPPHAVAGLGSKRWRGG